MANGKHIMIPTLWKTTSARRTRKPTKPKKILEEIPTRKCDECEYRFKCFTEPRGGRPKKVSSFSLEHSVNCKSCKNFTKYGKNTIGICSKKNIMIHITHSCGNHELRNTKWYKETKIEDIKQEILRVTARTYNGLPRICIMEGEKNEKR